jgi:hypothetical protein
MFIGFLSNSYDPSLSDPTVACKHFINLLCSNLQEIKQELKKDDSHSEEKIRVFIDKINDIIKQETFKKHSRYIFIKKSFDKFFKCYVMGCRASDLIEVIGEMCDKYCS